MLETSDLPPSYRLTHQGKHIFVSYLSHGLRYPLHGYWRREDNACKAAWEHYEALQAERYHPMHCTCGIPVLQFVEGTVTMYYVYRLASQGPESEIVRFCPGCGQELAESVREMNNG